MFSKIYINKSICNIFCQRILKKRLYKYLKRPCHNISNNVDMSIVAEIQHTLKSKNICYRDGHNCIIGNIPLCQNNNEKDCKVYINKKTGFFMCEKCNRIGSWEIIKKCIKLNATEKQFEEFNLLQDSIKILPDINKEWNKLKDSTKLIKNLPIDVYQNVIQKFNFKNLSQESMVQMNILYDHLSETLYFPLLSFHNLIVGYKYLSADCHVEKTFPPTNANGIIVYMPSNLNPNETAVIVSNTYDLLEIVSNEAANLVICLPYGLENIPQEILPCLENYKKLIIWFGNDKPVWDTAINVVKKLGEERCFIAKQIDKQMSLKLAENTEHNFQQILGNVKPFWHKSIVTFNSLRQDILNDLHNIDKDQGIKWNRFPALNKILKGHRKGEFTILTGPTGSGKTTFMSEYSLDLAMQGVNTLWGSFEIKNTRLARTMLQQMTGVPLEQNLEKFDSYADDFEKLPMFFMTFHGQQNIKDVLEAIEHASYMYDISHVIIDNVQFMMGTSDSTTFIDRFWKQDQIISVFRTFATKFNCHVSLVIHPRKEKDDGELTVSSIFGGVKASQEADNVLIIQDKTLTNIRGKKYLQVAKNRYSGDLGMMVLDFDKNSLSYAQQKTSNSEYNELSACEYLA